MRVGSPSIHLGPEVSNLSLSPILYKRLRIQGSTLRAQSTDRKAEIVRRSATPLDCPVQDVHTPLDLDLVNCSAISLGAAEMVPSALTFIRQADRFFTLQSIKYFILIVANIRHTHGRKLKKPRR